MRRALFVVAVLLIASCKAKSPTEPPLHTGSGKLVVTVMDSITHQGLPNITVQVYTDAGSLVASGVTDSAGVFETSLAAGGYRAQIVPPANNTVRAIQPASANVPISEGSTTAINVTVISV